MIIQQRPYGVKGEIHKYAYFLHAQCTYYISPTFRVNISRLQLTLKLENSWLEYSNQLKS